LTVTPALNESVLDNFCLYLSPCLFLDLRDRLGRPDRLAHHLLVVPYFSGV